MKEKIAVRLAYLAVKLGLDPACIAHMGAAEFISLRCLAARRSVS